MRTTTWKAEDEMWLHWSNARGELVKKKIRDSRSCMPKMNLVMTLISIISLPRRFGKNRAREERSWSWYVVVETPSCIIRKTAAEHPDRLSATSKERVLSCLRKCNVFFSSVIRRSDFSANVKPLNYGAPTLRGDSTDVSARKTQNRRLEWIRRSKSDPKRWALA